MSASPSLRTSLSDTSNSSKELCVVCQIQPYDLICTCGDKFDFTCIHSHVEQIGIEFQYVQVEVGQRLLQVEQLVEDNNCTNAKTIIENWKQKRIQDINDIYDDAFHQIEKQEKLYSEAAPLRVQYNSLSEESHHVVHEQLSSMVTLQRQVYQKYEQLENLPTLFNNDIELDSKIQSKLNPNIFHQKSSSYETKSIPTENTNIQISTEPITSLPTTTTTSNTNILKQTERTVSIPTINIEPATSLNEDTTNTEPTVELTNNSDENNSIKTTESSDNINENNSITNTESTVELTNNINENKSTKNGESAVELTNNNNSNDSTSLSMYNDEFDAGRTANIQRQNPIIISTNNDKFIATICCYKNQLLYNDFNEKQRNFRLTLISDITQPTNKQIIDWIEPDVFVGGGDDDCIQDITYSTKLRGYLCLNHSRLRFYNLDTDELEEFHQFPDRSMKRVTCNEIFICLISANGRTGEHGDEIILMNYNKQEKICKTFRDVVLPRNNRISGPLVAEISDLAINQNGQLIFPYRLERRQEVGVCLYNISNNGNDWTMTKHLLLNDCWGDGLSYTPRVEWSEKLNVFILVEHVTGHLIMLDVEGQIKGETRFSHVENRRDQPLNLSVSDDDWLCVRYESSINIHRLIEDRL